MKLRNRQGFTLVEIMIVVAIIGILIAIAVPGFIRAREASRTRAIQADLKRIDDAYQEYYIENNVDGGGTPEPTIQNLVDLGYLRSLPVPPVGTAYDPPTLVPTPTDSTEESAYPSHPDGDTDNERMHPSYLAAISIN